jgi:hypothetical protein
MFGQHSAAAEGRSDGDHSRIDSLIDAVQNPNLLIRNPKGFIASPNEASGRGMNCDTPPRRDSQ